MEDHQGRTRGHIWTHLHAAMAMRRWKRNDRAIKAHDHEIRAYDCEILADDREIVTHDPGMVAHDREIMAHDHKIVRDAWSLRSSSDGPQFK